MGTIGAIILAAGEARRFRGETESTKLLALFDARPIIHHVAAAALGSEARPVIVVTGHAAEKVEAALTDLDLQFVRNLDPAAGLSRSLKLGLDQLPKDASGVLVLLADMPLVTALLINRLIAAYDVAPLGSCAVVPVHAGRRGNPVLLGKTLFAAMKEIEGDRGARSLLDSLPSGVLELPIEDEAVVIDIDTPEMLARLAGP